MERTFVMVKPDGVERGLISEIIGAIEKKGYKLVGVKMLKLDQNLADRHYAEHVGKPFYEGLIRYITSGPVVAIAWEGKGVIKGIRSVVGATNPLEAAPGSIRGSFAVDIQHNLVHASDSQESAQREIGLYFTEAELIEYERAVDRWI